MSSLRVGQFCSYEVILKGMERFNVIPHGAGRDGLVSRAGKCEEEFAPPADNSAQCLCATQNKIYPRSEIRSHLEQFCWYSESHIVLISIIRQLKYYYMQCELFGSKVLKIKRTVDSRVHLSILSKLQHITITVIFLWDGVVVGE